MISLKKVEISRTKIIFLSTIFFILFDNLAFFAHLVEVYPLTTKNIAFLISLVIGLSCFTMLLLTLLCFKYTTKAVLITLLLLSSFASYFMNNYNVVIDHIMIQNIIQSNFNEAGDLLNVKLLYYILILGVLPSYLIYQTKIKDVSLKNSVITRLITASITLVLIFAMIMLFSKFYTSFFREHKPLRYYINPTYYLYSLGKYLNKTYNSSQVVMAPIGQDAHIPTTDLDRELIIFVVGEAVRADKLSINGYERQTTPLLQQEDVVSFSQMHSCGTSTSYSVPCMFSLFPRSQYSNSKGESNENLLDVLSHAGVNVLWRDNNSDSKGVAKRVKTQDYKLPENNQICDIECRDEGMLVGLQDYIDSKDNGDITIVLHQMGNHGPAYYKRYPKEFEKFTPVCETNQFDECTTEEINNAYDNAIVYTDYFLSKVIKLLKINSGRFETAMVYVSDHGESLGEHGIYLHGLPYVMAPEEQKHIGSIFWFGKSFELDKKALLDKSTKSFSQDNIFHTVLGLMEIETSVYDKSLDIINYDAQTIKSPKPSPVADIVSQPQGKKQNI